MKKPVLWGAAFALLLAGVAPLAGKTVPEPKLGDVSPMMRLITSEQYVNTLQSIFGAGLEYRVQFAPIQRVDGLLAVGATSTVMTSGAFDQFDSAARSIAAQVVDARRRDFLLPCKPAKQNAADDTCAGAFLGGTGRLLFRRSLTSDELGAYVHIAHDSAEAAHDFYTGLSNALTSLLVAPEFLYATQPITKAGNELKLTSYAKATRASLLLWNAYPDEDLLAAAESGALNTSADLARQVDRMLNSPKLEQGVRNFFDDMLVFEDFDTLSKDGTFYPAFTTKVRVDAKEQTLRTIIDHVVSQNRDYRDLFTTRKTFLTLDLGSIYGVPVRTDTAWTPYEFPPDSPRAGILTHASFLALHSHPARSSATRRGKALRELFLCQKVPPPPPNVNFGALEDPKSPFHTTRERVNFHLQNPVCAGCHRIMDPIGLALENFDGAGQYRTTEQGAAIDASGTLDGASFKDVAGLSKALHDHPQLPRCLVRRMTSYALGRTLNKDDDGWLQYADGQFSTSGYRVKDLLRTIATSPSFYAASVKADQ